ncbi:MAG: heat-inducible transcriptional repressor HrcA [Clostridia bacterium]
MGENNLSERKRKVLQALVDSYITSVEPISSNEIQARYMPEVSTATIRSELSTLEELGYLTQPHVSSGRIPSSKAYKYYVRNFIDQKDIDTTEIEKLVFQRFESVQEIVEGGARIVSDATNYTSMLMLSSADNIVVKDVKVVDLFDGSALVLVITDSGVISNKQISLPQNPETNYIEVANNLLAKTFGGKSLSEILRDKNMAEGALDDFRELCQDVVNLVADFKKTRDGKVFVEGTEKIFEYPEYQNMDNVKNFMSIVNHKDKLQNLLKEDGDIEFNIKIGAEDDKDLENMAIVSAVYKMDGKEIGQLGVIGPERMDYKKVLKVLKLLGKLIGSVNND